MCYSTKAAMCRIPALIILLFIHAQSFADRGISLEVTNPDQSTESIFLGNYHALVIGNNNYRHLTKLNTAINDANAVASLLEKKYRFEIKKIIDGTREDVLKALNDYRKKLTKNDNLLIYYAGHGILDEKADEGYWLPVDASLADDVNWISNNKVVNTLKALDAKHVLVIADSCFSGKLTRGAPVSKLDRDNKYLQRIAKKRARMVLTSGGLEPVADGNGQNSPFAKTLVTALSENTGAMVATKLFTDIREQVVWNEDQTPEYGPIHKAGHDGGDFIFVTSGLKLTIKEAGIVADEIFVTPKSTPISNPPEPDEPIETSKPWYKRWYTWAAGAVVAGFILSRCAFGEGSTEDKAGQGVSCN